MLGCQMAAKAAEDLLAIVDAASEDRIQALIESNPKSLQGRDADGNQALHIAARWGRTEVVTILVQAGADVNAVGANGWTPLHFSARSNPEICRFLLEHGADPKAVNRDGKTPDKVSLTESMRTLIREFKPPAKGLLEFLAAVEKADMTLLQTIADKAPEVIKATNSKGDTALICAARSNHLEVVNWLIAKGVDVKTINQRQYTALHEACVVANVDMVEALLKVGASPNPHPRQNLPKLNATLEGKNIMNLSPEELALLPPPAPITPLLIVTDMTSKESDEQLKQTLLDRVAQMKMSESLARNPSSFKQLTELKSEGLEVLSSLLGDVKMMSPRDVPEPQRQSRLRIMEMLVRHGADVNQTGGALWESPLEIAARNSSDEALELLLRLGADPRQLVFNTPPLVYALIHQNERKVMALLRAGARLTLGGSFNPDFSALFFATFINLEVVQLLLKEGKPTPAEVADSGALRAALSRGMPEIVKLLLDAGAGAAIASQGVTLLQKAVHSGSVDCVQILLDAGAKLEGKDEAGYTPLLDAIESGRAPVLKLLLDRGANVHATNKADFTAACLAAQMGDVEILNLVLKAGAKTHISGTGIDPLMAASSEGSPAIVKQLLEAGIKPTIRSTDSGRTALHFAAVGGSINQADHSREQLKQAGVAKPKIVNTGLAQHRHPESDWVQIVDLLITAGANINAAESQFGTTPVMTAARLGKAQIVSVLLKHKAQVDVAGKDGFTALASAASEGHLDTVRLLLEAGASIDAGSKDSISPLWMAVQQGHKDVAKLLIEKGADLKTPRGPPNQMATPLHGAAMIGDIDSAALMLTAGASINSRDWASLTPLIIASFNGHKDMAEFLIKHGADVNAVGKQDFTALRAARKSGRDSIVLLLRSHGAKE